jgi:hypothetical protein
VIESREVRYVLKFNRYYIFWEDYEQPYADKASAEQELARLKAEKPAYWNWRLVERETIVRERDVG